MDSDFFKAINPAQWNWYYIQQMLDEQDNFELLRDVAEHNAMFWNSEGVEQIRNARKNRFETSDFDSSIRQLFGRGVDLNNSHPLSQEDFGTDLKPYLDLEFDEVQFTPYGS